MVYNEQKEVFFFREGKDNRYISFTDTGKVIIAKNCSKPGFYKLNYAQERKTCIIADVTPVVWDYYRGISCEELKSVFKSLGFKIAFEMPFVYKYRDWKETLCTSDEMRIVVYNKDINTIIVADTFNVHNSFNSIECYCYGVSDQVTFSRYYSYFSRDIVSFSNDKNTFSAVFQIANAHIGSTPLHDVLHHAYKGSLPSGAKILVPSGWTYCDDPCTKEDFEAFRADFINRCPEDLQNWFK